jgi:hypothetical protein
MTPYIEYEGKMIPGTKHLGGVIGLEEHVLSGSSLQQAIVDFAIEKLGILGETSFEQFLSQLIEKDDELGQAHLIEDIMDAMYDVIDRRFDDMNDPQFLQ